ncbi:helix-turn-helix domain-containing protein [Arthrobacter sp. NPDC093128]|uniref:PucR family transcriptional regulator n=1 Tax=Arthrobacter sp. NPDC093128 TaxID=3154979 RepID=UPI00342F6210
MTDDGIQIAVDELAEHLRRSVVINDPGVHLLYSSVHFGDEDQIRVQAFLKRAADTKAIGYVLAQGVSTWTTPGVIPANEEMGMKARVCAPIRWRGELLGQLMVLDADRSLTTAELSLINQTAKDVAAAMAVEVQREADSKVQEQTVLDLVGREAVLRRRALAELAASHALGHFENVTAVEFWVRGTWDSATASHADAALRAVLTMGLRQGRGTQLHAMVASATGLLLLGSAVPLGEATARVHVQKMIDQLEDLSSGRFGCVAGIGPCVPGLEQAYKTVRQAHLARRAAATVLDTPVATWTDVGPYALLLRIPDEDLSEDILPEEVRRLLAVDPDRNLAKTLRVYLDHACNGPAASDALHIHRTTLYYRLGRIATLTGLDLSEGRTRLSLHLGLTMLDLIPVDHPH